MSRKKTWTRDELHEIMRSYPDAFNRDLAVAFGRSPKAISMCASRLRLKKSEAFKQMLRQLPGRFKRGHIPHNKGLPHRKKRRTKRPLSQEERQRRRSALDCMPNPLRALGLDRADESQ